MTVTRRALRSAWRSAESTEVEAVRLVVVQRAWGVQMRRMKLQIVLTTGMYADFQGSTWGVHYTNLLTLEGGIDRERL